MDSALDWCQLRFKDGHHGFSCTWQATAELVWTSRTPSPRESEVTHEPVGNQVQAELFPGLIDGTDVSLDPFLAILALVCSVPPVQTLSTAWTIRSRDIYMNTFGAHPVFSRFWSHQLDSYIDLSDFSSLFPNLHFCHSLRPVVAAGRALYNTQSFLFSGRFPKR